MTYEMEYVEWLDSQSEGSPWADPGDLDGRAARASSVGYVAKESDESLTLAQSLHAEEGVVSEWGHALTIPKCAITRRVRLEQHITYAGVA